MRVVYRSKNFVDTLNRKVTSPQEKTINKRLGQVEIGRSDVSYIRHCFT